jgi:hypothetical protein
MNVAALAGNTSRKRFRDSEMSVRKRSKEEDFAQQTIDEENRREVAEMRVRMHRNWEREQQQPKD